jgi:DNA repair exonuclease SbcCD ATPase subunit
LIIFKNLRWKNFLSTGNSFTEIKLDKTDTTLIVGENGSGKSTMLDALSFGLYNKPFRKINKPQLVNSINKKDLVVEVEFSIGPNQYKIIRGIKPNVFEVYQNDNLLNQNAESKDYQEILENQILKLNHKSFCQVVVLGSASFVPFMQLTAQARREVIEDLLDIQIFSTMNSLLKEDVSENSKSLQQAEYNYNLTSEKIKLQNDYVAMMQKDTGEQVEKINKEIVETKELIEVEKNKISDLDKKLADYDTDIVDEKKVRDKHQKLSMLQRQLNEKIKKIEHDIEFFNKHDNCPTCKQVIQEDFKCDSVGEKNKSIEETRDGLTQLNAELNKLYFRIETIDEIKKEITDINIQVITHNNNINGLKSYIGKLQRNIDDLNKKTVDYTMNDDKMKQLEVDLETYIGEKGELIKQKEALQIASIILKDSGIKSRIIKQYVPVINKLINKYLASMDFFVQFELDETFNEKIKSRFRDEFSYSSFSEGEKMRINLAILFTWRAVAKMRNSASTNLLIMDEVMDSSLDVNGTNEFLKILNSLTKDTNTFIISHKTDQLVDKFNKVIKFEKSKNFSRIV